MTVWQENCKLGHPSCLRIVTSLSLRCMMPARGWRVSHGDMPGEGGGESDKEYGEEESADDEPHVEQSGEIERLGPCLPELLD